MVYFHRIFILLILACVLSSEKFAFAVLNGENKESATSASSIEESKIEKYSINLIPKQRLIFGTTLSIQPQKQYLILMLF